jgi:hypothetical protein
LPGRGIEPAPRLQAQRTRLTQNSGQRLRMQGLLHDALPAIGPDDAGQVEAEARQAWRIAIGKACGPKEKSILAMQKPGCGYCRESRRSCCRFAFAWPCAKFVKRRGFQAALRQRCIELRVGEGYRAGLPGYFQTMAFEGADLHP